MELGFPAGKPSPSSFQEGQAGGGSDLSLQGHLPVSPVPTESQIWEQGQHEGTLPSLSDTAEQAQLAGRAQLQNMWHYLSPPARGGDTARQGGPGGTRSASATARGASGWRSQPGQSPWRGGKVA